MKKKIYYGSEDHSKLGTLWAAVSDVGLWSISFGITEDMFIPKMKRKQEIETIQGQPRVQHVLNQLQEYLNGRRTQFDLEIDWSEMTAFQTAILKATIAVPVGRTAAYGELAAAVGSAGAARAVGRVQATNPIPLVIPCHRILSAAGKLHGYSSEGGLDTKAWLLKLEGFSPISD